MQQRIDAWVHAEGACRCLQLATKGAPCGVTPAKKPQKFCVLNAAVCSHAASLPCHVWELGALGAVLRPHARCCCCICTSLSRCAACVSACRQLCAGAATACCALASNGTPPLLSSCMLFACIPPASASAPVPLCAVAAQRLVAIIAAARTGRRVPLAWERRMPAGAAVHTILRFG